MEKERAEWRRYTGKNCFLFLPQNLRGNKGLSCHCLRTGFFFLLFFLATATLSSQSADQFYQSGRQAFTDELWPTAASNFSRLLREYPEDFRADSASYMAAVAYYNAKKYQDCIEILKFFAEEYPDSVWNQRVAYWEALAYYALEDWRGAARGFLRQTTHTGEPIYLKRALFYLGACQENLKDWSAAQDAYTKILDIGQDYDLESRVIFRLGQIHLTNKESVEALGFFNRLAYDYSDSPAAQDIMYWIAESQRQLGQNKRALSTYQNFLLTTYDSPYRSYSLLEAARLAVAEGLDEEALAYLELRTEELPVGSDKEAKIALPLRAALYVRRGDLALARQDYTALLSDSLNAEEAQRIRFNLAQTYLGTAEEKLAIPYLEQAAEGPDHLVAADALYLAATLLWNNQDSQGADLFHRFADRYPNDERREEVLRLLVRVWRDEGKIAPALKALNSLLSDYSQSKEAAAYLFLRAELAVETDDSTAALAYYAQLIRRYPNSSWVLETYSRMGFLYSERQEYARAASYYERAIQLPSVSGDEAWRRANYSAGIAYLNAGDEEKALNFFNTLLQADPKALWYVEASYQKGETLYAMGDYEGARLAYQITIQEGSRDWIYKAYYGIGWTWFRIAAWSDAIQAFEQAAAHALDAESRGLAQYRLGLSRASAGEWEEALIPYKEALKIKKSSWREGLLYQYAWILLNLEKETQARLATETLSEEFPDSDLPADLPFRMGEEALHREDYVSARYWYNQCIADYPGSSTAIRAALRVALLTSREGQYATAAQQYARWVLRHPQDDAVASAARSWGEALKATDDPVLASAAFRSVLEAGNLPLSALAPVVLSWARVTGIPLEAEPYLERYANDQSLAPVERAEALLLRAHRYRKENDLSKAQNLYEILVRDIPGRLGAEAQEGLAQTYAEKGDIDRAAETYSALPSLYPKQNDIILRALAEAERLYREAERHDEADKIKKRRQTLASDLPE